MAIGLQAIPRRGFLLAALSDLLGAHLPEFRTKRIAAYLRAYILGIEATGSHQIGPTNVVYRVQAVSE